MKATAMLRQVAVASFVAWSLVGAITPVLMLAQGLPAAGAAARACFIVAILAIGAGAAGISGGVAPEPRISWLQPRRVARRDDGPKTQGPLTLLGLALLVAPQLILVAIALF